VLAWAAGVGLLSVWQLAGWIAAARLKRLAVRPGQGELIELLARLARAMRVSRPVRLLESMLVRVPTVVGWFRPVVLLPAGLATGLTPDQVEAVLAHELAHIRRCDYLVNLLQSLVETLLFYHPAVWFVSRRIRAERENCCDDVAVAAGAERFSYAESLLHLARRSAAARGARRLLPAGALAAAGRPSQLRTRIGRLLGGQETTRLARSWPIALGLLAGMLVATSIFVNVRAESADPSSKAAEPGDDALHRVWEDLASPEPLKAYRAAWTLAGRGEQAIAFIQSQVPVTALDADRARGLIGELDADKYQARERAYKALAAMGGLVAPLLREAMRAKPSPEARARIEALLKRIEHPQGVPEARRVVLAARALELMNSASSRRLLERMAEGSVWGAAAAADALSRLSQGDTAPDLAGKTVLLAQWQVIARPEMIEAILARGSPVPITGEGFTAVRCDGEDLLAAVRPGLVVPEGMDRPAMFLPGSSVDWWVPPRQRQSRGVIWSTSGFLYEGGKGAGPVATCGVNMIAGVDFRVSEGRVLLDVVGRAGGPNLNWNDGPQIRHRFDKNVKLRARCAAGEAVCLIVDLGRRGPHHPHALIVLQTVAAPQRFVPYFKASRSGERWLREGSAGVERLAAEGLAWNALAAARKGMVNPRWVRTLPGGTQVRVAAVWSPQQHPLRTWDGDGNPIPCDPQQVAGLIGSALGVRIEGRSSDKEPWTGLSRTSSGRLPGKIEIGVGDGPWKMSRPLPPDQSVQFDGRSYKLEARPFQRKGFFRAGTVIVTMPYKCDPAVDVAVGALDKKGRLILPPALYTRHAMTSRQAHDLPGYFHAVLPVDASDVKQYVLLTRGRHWATFQNLAPAPKLPPAAPTTRPAVRQGSPPAPQPAGRLVFDPAANIAAVKPRDWVVRKVVKGDQPFGLVAGKGTGIYLGPPRREDDPEQKQMPYASVVWIMPAEYSGDPVQTEGHLQIPTPQLIAALADAKVYVWGLSAWPAPPGARARIQAAVNRSPTTAPADGRRSALLTRLTRLGVTPKTARRMVFVGSDGDFRADTRVEAAPDMRKAVWTAIAVAQPFNRIVFSGFRRVEFYTAADAAKPAAVLCVNQTDSTHLEGRYEDRFRCAGLTELTEPLLRAQYERRHPPAVRQRSPQAPARPSSRQANGASPDGASTQAAVGTAPDGAAKASDSFGAVTERSLVDPAGWIDLDRNQVKSPPRSAQASTEALVKWFRDDEIDAWRELKYRGLGCVDLKAVALDEAEWDGLTAAQLDEALGMRKAVQPTDEGLAKVVYLKGAEGRAMTYAFRTREGGSGILQILEAQTTDRPLFVKIRYKMVNRASPSKSTTRPATQPAPNGPATQPAPETRKGGEESKQALEARIAELIERLGSDKFEQRKEAQKALVRIGKPAVEALNKAMGSGDPEVALRAEQALNLILPVTIAIRTAAAPSPIDGMLPPLLVVSVKNNSREPFKLGFMDSSYYVLDGKEHLAITEWSGPMPANWAVLPAKGSFEYKYRLPDGVWKAAKGKKLQWKVRGLTSNTIVLTWQSNPLLTKRILETLSAAPVGGDAEACLRGLRFIGRKPLVSGLKLVLGSNRKAFDARRRGWALGIVARDKLTELMPEAKVLLKEDEDAVKREVLLAMARIPAATALEDVAPLAASKDDIVRRYLAGVLGELDNKDGKAAALLRKMIADEDSMPAAGYEQHAFVKIWACGALGKLKDRTGIPVLIQMLKEDASRSFRGNVRNALQQITELEYSKDEQWIEWWAERAR